MEDRRPRLKTLVTPRTSRGVHAGSGPLPARGEATAVGMVLMVISLSSLRRSTRAPASAEPGATDRHADGSRLRARRTPDSIVRDDQHGGAPYQPSARRPRGFFCGAGGAPPGGRGLALRPAHRSTI